ncbi:unnamed protein product [Gadus morhua 'NCC']
MVHWMRRSLLRHPALHQPNVSVFKQVSTLCQQPPDRLGRHRGGVHPALPRSTQQDADDEDPGPISSVDPHPHQDSQLPLKHSAIGPRPNSSGAESRLTQTAPPHWLPAPVAAGRTNYRAEGERGGASTAELDEHRLKPHRQQKGEKEKQLQKQKDSGTVDAEGYAQESGSCE